MQKWDYCVIGVVGDDVPLGVYKLSDKGLEEVSNPVTISKGLPKDSKLRYIDVCAHLVAQLGEEGLGNGRRRQLFPLDWLRFLQATKRGMTSKILCLRHLILVILP